jgi:hypothetical protein
MSVEEVRLGARVQFRTGQAEYFGATPGMLGTIQKVDGPDSFRVAWDASSLGARMPSCYVTRQQVWPVRGSSSAMVCCPSKNRGSQAGG